MCAGTPAQALHAALAAALPLLPHQPSASPSTVGFGDVLPGRRHPSPGGGGTCPGSGVSSRLAGLGIFSLFNRPWHPQG